MKMGIKYKRKAKNAGRQALYQAMWQEEVPAKYRKCGGRLMTPKNQNSAGKGRAPAVF